MRIKVLLLFMFVGIAILIAGCTGDEIEKLSSPENIRYRQNEIRWDSVDNAESYIVTINDDSFETSNTYYAFNAEERDFHVRVQTIGNEEFYEDSEVSETFTFYYLDQVENINVNDGIVEWNAVDDAEGYILKINGVEQDPVYSTYYDALTPGESSTIMVRPMRESSDFRSYYSDYSNEVMATILPSPVIQFDNGSQTIYWDSVSGAGGYQAILYLDNEVVETKNFGVNTTSFNYEYTIPGEYDVMVKTMPSGSSHNDSKYSKALTITRLSAPEEIISLNQTDGVTYINFRSVNKAEAYEISVNDSNVGKFNRSSFEYTFDSTTLEVIHDISIKALGNNNYVLDSVEGRSIELTKLGQPQNISFNGGTVTWDSVDKNNGYVVNVNGTEYSINSAEFDLPILEAGIHSFSVRARGNDSYIVGSDQSSNYQFTKLPRPSNIRINDGTLAWDSVSDATSYQVMLGDTVLTSSSNTTFDINASSITENTAIKVIARGNGQEILDSDYSQTHQVFRLSTPTNLSYTNNNINWNAVGNVTHYLLRINSNLYVVEGTSFAWSGISEGNKLISVQAIGDQQVYFNSSETNQISASKLAIPDFQITSEGIEWTHVTGASQYEIMVGNNTYNVSSEEHLFKPEINSAGEYEVKMRAIGDGETSVTSDYASTMHSVTTLSSLTGDPAFTVDKDGDYFNIRISNEHAEAIGYYVNIGGVNYFTDSLEYQHRIESSGSYTISVKAAGDGFNTMDSNYSSERTLTVLSALSERSIIYQKETDDLYAASWNPVSQASGYHVTVIKRNADNEIISEGSILRTHPNVEFFIEDATSIELRIVVKGNGHTTFDSATKTSYFTPIGD